MDKGKAISSLKERMRQIQALPDEPEFATSDETIIRYLKANEWKLKDAEKNLLQTIEYRRKTRPLHIDCKWCHSRPGYHSMRQVGQDESGRPVIYANFAQASTHKNSVEDIVCHMTYVIENAKATMGPGVTTWVFIVDCSGMSLSACNPNLGKGIANELINHYPERLGLVICVNHNTMFHGVWKALKSLLSSNTASKVKLIKSSSKIRQTFQSIFDDELSNWLLSEIALNSQKPLPRSQSEFWAKPSAAASSKPKSGSQPRPTVHDPRGCPSYVRQMIDKFQPDFKLLLPGHPKKHCPHPNIVDAVCSGTIISVALSPEEEAERSKATCFPKTSHSSSKSSDPAEGFDYSLFLDVDDESDFDDDDLDDVFASLNQTRKSCQNGKTNVDSPHKEKVGD